MSRQQLQLILAIRSTTPAYPGYPLLVGFNAGFKYDSARKAVAQSMQMPLVIYGGPKLDLVHPTADGYATLVDNVVDRMTIEGILESLQARTAAATSN